MVSSFRSSSGSPTKLRLRTPRSHRANAQTSGRRPLTRAGPTPYPPRPLLDFPCGCLAGAPMSGVDPTSLLVIVGVAALSGLIVMALSPRMTIPVVVVELRSASSSAPTSRESPSSMRPPSSSATSGSACSSSSRATRWTSTASGAAARSGAARVGHLAAARLRPRRDRSPPPAWCCPYLYTGSAMATTAIGMLIPILRDAGSCVRASAPTCLLRAASASSARSSCSPSSSPAAIRCTRR